jgi:predicted metallo-beta-lactamase superfamily hydrolase
MKVVPLAADSLGVRSMATYVEVAGTGILIDPGATLAPSRFGLPPATEEWEALRRANDRISAYAARAALVFVSHYHEDHFRSDPATYAGRTVLVKDPKRMIGGLQARRGSELWTVLTAHARPTVADGYERREHDVELRVSSPLPHGVEATTLGYVVALSVVDRAERERFVFASDVQGPLSAVAAGWLIRERPTLVYLAGPPAYIEREVGTAVIERGIDNLLRVIDATGCRVIMDHHAVRDAAFGARFERLWATGRVVTAAAHLGLEPSPLESRRRQLWTAVARKAPARSAGAPARSATPAGAPPTASRIRRIAKGGRPS